MYSLDGLCPPLEAPNQNAFRSSFGIEFNLNDAGFIHQVSPFEHMRCFQLCDDITHALSHPANYSLCDSGIPAWTSFWIIHALQLRLDDIRTDTVQIVDTSHHAAPAALSMVPTFLSEAIGTRLPSPERWAAALAADPECVLLTLMAYNPGDCTKKRIDSVHHVYRQSVR